MKRLLLINLLFILAYTTQSQTTVTYAQRTENYYTTFADGGNIYNKDSCQVGMWANQGNKHAVSWRKFRTDASGASSSDRALQVGDQFVVTLSATRAKGRIGFALLSSPTSTSSWADRENNYALSVNLDGPDNTTNYGNWYIKYNGGATSATSFGGLQDTYTNFTFTMTLTAPDRMNITITNGTNTDYFNDVQLNNSYPITDIAIFLEDDNNGAENKDIFWGLGHPGDQFTLTNSGVLSIGASNNSFTVSSVIPNGLDAASSSTSSTNNLTKNGSGTVTLSGTDTYSGTTTVSAGTLQLEGSLASSDVTVESGATLVLNGSASTVKSLTINSGGTVTVNPTKALTVNGDLTNNGTAADLVIKSDDTGTGSLIVTGSVTGDATVQRYMTTYTSNDNGWHFLSAPVSNFTISASDFEPGTGEDLYEFSESALSEPWLNYNGGTFGDSQFQTGKGYLVAYSGTAATKSFTGNINTGTFAKSLSFTSGSAGEGWNLLGNPYTSAIDWDLLTKSTSVDGSVYVLRASDGAYISWNGTTGGLTDGIIPAMQGYFVHVTASSQSVTMETADQVHSSTNYYKSGKELAENTFYITVNGNNGQSNAYIQFRDDATKTFDNAFDAYKLFGYSTAPQIYTNDGENIYSINCLPADMQNYSLPMGVKISTLGEYQISFSGIENVSDNFDIKLEDLQTGEQISVNPETTYKFTVNEGDDPNRFVLHFYNVTSTPEIGETNNKALIYSYNNNIIVKATDKQLNGKVEIINILGQTIETKPVSNSNFFTINTNLNKGVYIVRYSETDGYTQAQKVIIN